MGFPVHNFPLKIFVREENIREDNAVNEVNTTAKTLTGDSAREFYESVIKEGSTAKSKPPVSRKKIKTRSDSQDHNHKTFPAKEVWKLAQNNDYISLEKLLKENKNMSIDCKDPFGWTPLMCAACSGAKECVEILVNNKADPSICDKSGNTALTLAKRNNFPHIVSILKNGNNNSAKNEDVIKRKNMGNIFCQTCNSVFHTDLKNHECSTLHLFNNPGRTRMFYGIPESNKGFQMLLKNGWDKEKGLGLNEDGMSFPIKVKKKNDRIGLGGVIPKIQGHSNEDNGVRKEKRFRSEKNWKRFERNFKLEFS